MGRLEEDGNVHLQQGATSKEDTWRTLDYAIKETVYREKKHGYDQDQTVWYQMLCVLEEANQKQ